MPTNEKEININLMERLHLLKRIKKVATKEGATVQEIIEAIDDEAADINEMLYQNPPLTDN